jgi:hypothetical protein
MKPINSILLEQFQNPDNDQVQSNLPRDQKSQIEISQTEQGIGLHEGSLQIITEANLTHPVIIEANQTDLHGIIILEGTADSHSD